MSAGNLPPDERLDRVGFKSLLGFCISCKKLYPLSGSVKVCPACGQPLQEVIPVNLARINASMINKEIAMDVVLTGESGPKATPVKWRFVCRKCGEDLPLDFRDTIEFENKQINLLHFFIESMATPSKGPTTSLVRKVANQFLPKYNSECKKGGKHQWHLEPEEYIDFKVVNIRPDISLYGEEFGETFERNYTAITLDTDNLDSQIFTAVGRVVPHTPRRDLIPVIEHIIPKRKLATKPLKEELKHTKEFFRFMELNNWLEFLEPRFCPGIVGRPDAKLAALLTIASPAHVQIKASGRTILSTLRTIFIGDTRTGKGSIIRWVRDNLRVDAYAIGETSRRTGLGFTVDKDTGLLIWGVLPMADGRLALIEALHGFPSDQLMQLREALYQGHIVVRMKVSGRRFCRCRILADANAPKHLEMEAYWCLAIPKVKCFRDPIDITRWDILVPFSTKDVGREEIAEKQDRPDNIQFIKALETLRNFAWSLRGSEINLSDDAYKELKTTSKELIEEYSFPLVPIVHDGFRENLLKTAAAFAVCCLNVKDGILEIAPEHIDLARKFYEHLFDRWELGAAKERYEEPGLTQADWLVIKEALKEEDALIKILEIVALKQLDGRSLAAESGYAYSYVRKLVARLKELGLVDRRGGVYELTRKGVDVHKRLPELWEEGGDEKGGG